MTMHAEPGHVTTTDGARRRCRSSSSGSWLPGPPGGVFVANAVTRHPLTSLMRSCAPRCGRSLADDHAG